MAELTMEQTFVKSVHTKALSVVEARIKGPKGGAGQCSSTTPNGVSTGGAIR